MSDADPDLPTRSPSDRDEALPPALPGFAGARCIVTGGLGFIGSNLALALAGGGADVVVVDRVVPTHGANPHNIEGAPAPITVLSADIGDPVVADAVAGVDVVFNLAGQVSHVDSMEDPVFDLDVNARSHLQLLEAIRAGAPDATVVYASTRQIYGRIRSMPVTEDHPTVPVDVNGVGKLAGEQAHLVYHRAYGLRTSALRLTNIYGPRQRLSGDRQGFLPVFVRRILSGEPLTLYGDGEQLRDCLHVDDVVTAMGAAALAPEAAGEAFNISDTSTLSLKQIAEELVAAAGTGTVTYIPWPDERARIDIGSYHGDISKAAKLLGWEPTVAFADGIRRTIAYYREHLAWYLSST